MKMKLIGLIKYIVLFALLSMPIFGHLNSLPIRLWDESRLAINAYEMLKNKNYLVTHINDAPDMWNTKPPLLIWLQVACMKLMGINELAVRLPSAIAAFATCMALLFFSILYLKNFWFGFISVLVLVTTNGYIHEHASRTGDYDALLTLLTTLSGLSVFIFFQSQKQQYLYAFFIFTALAVLTKSITGLLFLPAIFIYAVIQKQFVSLLSNKHFYWGILCFLIPVLGYYLLREHYNPGYLNAVYKNEFGGRYFEIIEEHKHEFWFYFNNMVQFQLPPWHLLVPCGAVIGLASKDKKINALTLFSLLMVVVFFFVISFAQTKLEWYTVPLFPFLALIIAVFVFHIFYMLQNYEPVKNTLAFNVIPFVFLFLLTVSPYQKVINKTYRPLDSDWERENFEISYYLKNAVKGKYSINGQYLVYDGYDPHHTFYLKMLNEKGISISHKHYEFLEKNDTVIVQQNALKQFIEKHYEFSHLGSVRNVSTYHIYGKKEQPQH